MAGDEAKIERRVCERAFNELGVDNFKWGVDGWPDRVYLMPGGRPFLIEFKRPGESLRPRQEFRIECLKLWGYNVEVHDDADRAFQAITRALDSARLLKESSEVSAGARVRRFVPRSRPRKN
jgi:hypothetical protein